MRNQQQLCLLVFITWLSTLACESKIDSSWMPFINKLLEITFLDEYTIISNTAESVWGKVKVNTHGCRLGWGDIDPPDKYPCGIITPPTPPQGNLTWNISVHPLYHVNVTILNFNLTSSLEGCRVESLHITWSNDSHD